MHVKDIKIITECSYCVPSDTCAKAAGLMQAMNAEVVPIVKSDTDKTVIGIVSDRDLCMAIVAANLHPSAVPLECCMNATLSPVKISERIERALYHLCNPEIQHLIVVHDDGGLCGIVSLADLLFQRTYAGTQK